ncbi:MAG TPA: MarR family transcriptional regulator [Acidimicrobiales bacterium]|nr:MarR family transcriptional regulator [Acidimicrobiales bacterium]
MATQTGLLGSHLRLAVLRLSRRLRKESVGDITPSQLSALTAVERHGEVTLGELAAIERIAPPSMTRIASRLEERGLVERHVDPSDRRVARLAASPSGTQLLETIRNRRDAYLAARLQEFTPEERAILERAVPLLERLAAKETPES